MKPSEGFHWMSTSDLEVQTQKLISRWATQFNVACKMGGNWNKVYLYVNSGLQTTVIRLWPSK